MGRGSLTNQQPCRAGWPLALHLLPAPPPVWGFYNASSRYRGFRKNDAANLLIVPTTNLYIPRGRAAGGAGASGSGLSTGAVVGIAVGAAAGAALLAGAAWAAVWQRRRRLAAAAAPEDAALSGKEGQLLPALDQASSGSSRPGRAAGSASTGSPQPSALDSGAGSQGSPRGRAGPPLAELLERVASVEAAAATSLGPGPAACRHDLLSAESLPPRLREFLVPPSAVTYCRWPNGQPQEIGAGATSRVFKAMLNGALGGARPAGGKHGWGGAAWAGRFHAARSRRPRAGVGRLAASEQSQDRMGAESAG